MSTPIALWLAEKLEDPESAHGYRLVANNAADELRRLHQENEQLKALADQSVGCQCPACEKTLHASDCAVHNAPAYPVGECDCGAQLYPENFIDALTYDVARRDSEQQCRTDGRCQYAIDSGAEGMGHCPKGKCVMPSQQKPKRYLKSAQQPLCTAAMFDEAFLAKSGLPPDTPLYTSPPAQRTWVGLTDKERIMCRSYDPEEAVAKTEAKLKEKNT